MPRRHLLLQARHHRPRWWSPDITKPMLLVSRTKNLSLLVPPHTPQHFGLWLGLSAWRCFFPAPGAPNTLNHDTDCVRGTAAPVPLSPPLVNTVFLCNANLSERTNIANIAPTAKIYSSTWYIQQIFLFDTRGDGKTSFNTLSMIFEQKRAEENGWRGGRDVFRDRWQSHVVYPSYPFLDTATLV